MLSEGGYGGDGGGGGGRHHCPLQQQNQNQNQKQPLRRGDPDLMAAFASRVTELRRVERDGRQYLASACASAGAVAEHADPPEPARRAAASGAGRAAPTSSGAICSSARSRRGPLGRAAAARPPSDSDGVVPNKTAVCVYAHMYNVYNMYMHVLCAEHRYIYS